MCFELLPELTRLDDWGYPIVGVSELPDELIGLARKAVDACVTLRCCSTTTGTDQRALSHARISEVVRSAPRGPVHLRLCACTSESARVGCAR